MFRSQLPTSSTPMVTAAESVLSESCDISYQLPNVVNESSLASIDPADITEDNSTLTFRIVGKSTKRGCGTLIDSRGFSYTLHREGKRSNLWRCAIRNKTISSKATES
jgi:hypothetical protein